MSAMPANVRAQGGAQAEPRRGAAGAGSGALREAALLWVERAGPRPDEPAWLAERRAAAAARFRAAGFPTVHEEEWRFTPLDPILRAELMPARAAAAESAGAAPGAGAAPAAGTILPPSLPGEARFVVVDGVLSRGGAPFPAGLEVVGLAAALRADPERLRPHLVAIAEDAAPPAFRGLPVPTAAARAFADLNTALFEDGLLVRVRAGTMLEAPVHLVHAPGPHSAGSAAQLRALIVLEEGASATVVESWVSPPADDRGRLAGAVTEIALADGAVLRHVRVQDEGAGVFHLATVAVRQGRDSVYEAALLSMGAALARVELDVVLDGEGAGCTLEGLYVAADRQLVDHHTFVDHRKPRTQSRERFKGVADGAARMVFEGRVKVRPGAQKISAHQENRNLLLSDTALAHTKPSLEIDADDVKCSHGATVGQLDEDALFYLRARGIDAASARAILTQAFAREVLDRVRPPALRRRLAVAALARVGSGAPAGVDPWEAEAGE